ncbi:MAG: amino acid transporter substrate-binding protein [Frankiales bacterium]|nr:amino acid transporter substrate-binding protein [Frankiales bacterium]
MTTSDHDPRLPASRPISRRNFLSAAGFGGMALAASPLLAACSTSKPGSAKTIGSATASAASATELKKILDYIGPYDPKFSGAGTTWKLGATLPFSGNGSFFGKLWQSGIDLAVAHIKEIGGPTIQIVSSDNGSGDAQKSHNAVQQMVAAKVPGIIGTEALGGVWAPLAQYKILCLDSGAGAPIGIQGIPYYYGARSAYYSDQWVGTLEYMKQTMSDKKSIVTIDNVSTIFDPKPALRALIPNYGFQYKSSVTATTGATDYSSVIAALHQAKPDVIWASISQFDIGYFMKQYLTSGLKAPVFAFQWTRAARAIAGNGYTNQYFSTEYLDVDKPSNPWQDLYIQEYKSKNGLTPEAYTADFYMCVFMWWQLMRDVLAKGGNINRGPDLLAALQARPTFNTVFGGDATTPGLLTMDLKTHSPSALPQAVFQDTGNSLKQLATYDVGGGNFKMG